MKRLLIVAGTAIAACAAAMPAFAGISGNPSFSHRLPVRVPAQAQLAHFDDHGDAIVNPADSSKTGTSPTATPATRRPEPGDDRSNPSGNPGADRDRDRHDGPGDRDRGRDRHDGPGDRDTPSASATATQDRDGADDRADDHADDAADHDRHDDRDRNDDRGHHRHGGDHR
jgi:hypothetical protein